MKERPILLAPSMALATVNDLKTQTRRLAKGVVARHSKTGEALASLDSSGPRVRCPYGEPGDHLWGREAHRFVIGFDNRPPREVSEGTPVLYLCDGVDLIPGVGPAGGGWTFGKYRPPMFMPRWASRILLEITEVRAQRLQEISEADCIAEGAPGGHGSIPGYGYNATPDEHYRSIWEAINGPGSWAANPWVWAVSFRKVAS